jgi:hypothetical protein
MLHKIIRQKGTERTLTNTKLLGSYKIESKYDLRTFAGKCSNVKLFFILSSMKDIG